MGCWPSTHTKKKKCDETEIIMMRAFGSCHSFFFLFLHEKRSPYLTDTWDSTAGNGAEVIYSSQPWIYLESTSDDDED